MSYFKIKFPFVKLFVKAVICLMVVGVVQSCGDDEESSEVLLRTTIPDDLLWIDDDFTERGFLFLSDDEGNLIASTEFQNGQEIELSASGFKGSSFYVTEVRYEPGDESEVYTVGGVPKGSTWKMISYYQEDEEYAGEVTLNFTNYPTASPPQYYRLFSNGDETSVYENSSEVIRLETNTSKLFALRYNSDDQPPVSYNTFDATVGTPANINLSTVNKTLTSGNATVGTSTNYFEYLLYGLIDNPAQEIRVFDYYAEDPDAFTYYYPGTEFSSYKSRINFDTDNSYYERVSVSNKFEIKMIPHEIEYVIDGSGLTYDASGDFDLILFHTFGDTFYHVYVLPPGSGEIPAFDFPDAIRTLTAGDMGYSYSVIDANASIDDNADLLALINSEDGLVHFLDNAPELIQVEYFNDAEWEVRAKKHGKRKNTFLASRRASFK